MSEAFGEWLSVASVVLPVIQSEAGGSSDSFFEYVF